MIICIYNYLREVVLKKILVCFAVLFFTYNYGQNSILMPTNNTTLINPAGNNVILYDSGGENGNYASSSNGSITLNCNPGQFIKLFGTFETEPKYNGNFPDKILIKVGSSIKKTIAGNAFESTESTNNTWFRYDGLSGEALTISFSSDGSTVASGFKILVTYSTVATVNIQPTSNNQTINTDHVIYDSGGRTGEYSSNANHTITINTSTGYAINLIGNTYMEAADKLEIYEFNGTSYVLVNSYSSSKGFVFTAISGRNVRIKFTSDNPTNLQGFEIAVKILYSSGLPVSLTNFSASCDQHVSLNWSTASEQNSDIFNIEKSSNGMDWEFVSSVQAAGNSNTAINYSIEDKNNRSGITYYRLVQLDLDGKQEVFGPISVDCEREEEDFFVFPNPTSAGVTVQIDNNSDLYRSTLSVVDITGKIIYSDELQVVSGTNQFHLSKDTFKKGAYIIRLNSLERGIRHTKLVVN